MGISLDYNTGSALCMGDILSEFPYREIVDCGDTYEERITIFPYVVVASQSCDLLWDGIARRAIRAGDEKPKYGNLLLSAIVMPLHNFDQFLQGNHMKDLGWEIPPRPLPKKSKSSPITQNSDPRFHYLEFDPATQLVPSIVDFKHFFACPPEQIELHKDENHYMGTLQDLFKELLVQRFANYISRIGLPVDDGVAA